MKQPICLHTVGSTLKHLALAVALAVGLGAGTSQAEPPVNDNFADAIDLTGSGTGQTGIATLGTQSGTGTVGATSESGETVWASSNTVWFKWTCATAGFLTFSTEGSLSIYNGPWDAAMSAYTGSSLATLTQLVAQDTTTAEIVTMEVVPGTYYIQACGYNLPPPDDTADLQLSWSFKVQSDTLVDISNAIGPAFDGGVRINDIVGLGNIGNIVGETRTYWDSKGFVVPLILNDNTLIIDSGNGNSMNAQGPISGNGTVTIDGGGSDTVLISGSTGNTYTGTTQVAQGPVGLAKNNGNALCGAITVTGSTVVWGASNQISDTSSVTLDATSVLDLAGFSDTIGNLTLAAGSTVATGTSGVLTANTLMVNGTPVTAGTYTSSSSFVTGTGSLVVSNTAVVPASAANSTVTASPAEVQANGTSASTITVTLFNASNAPAPGKTVTLTSSRALGIDTIAEASGVSDASGVVTFAVTSTTIGNPVFTATDTTDSVTITDTATVSFIAINYVVDISTTLTPGPDGPTQGIVIDTVVGEGYSGRLVGSTQTYWGSGGFSRALDLNGNTLIIDNGNGNTMNASGAISGNGIVQVDGGGGNPVRIMGDTGNTYTGTTEVLEGPVNLEKTSGNALCGAITVTGSTVVWAASDQISDTSNVSLGSSSVLNLAGFSDTIGNLTMTTGNTVATGGIGGILTVNSLILDGTPVTAGTYTSSSAFVSGDGSLVVSTTATLPASAANSTLAASPSSVLADGTSTSTITVTLLDAGSPPAPIAGKTVTLASNRSAGTDTISTTSSVSDASGVVTFTVQSSTVGSAIFTATDTTDSITITATVTVTYTTPPTYVDISNATTPWEPLVPAAGVRINDVVASGNTARLIGLTQTHWGSGGFSRPLTLNGNTLIIDSGGGNTMNISGAITGTGVITFNGWGANPIRMQGATSNDYTATNTVNGNVSLEKTSGNALCGPITVNGSSSLIWAASDQLPDTSVVTLSATATLTLNGKIDTINELYLVSNSVVSTGAEGVLKVTKLFINGTEQAAVAKIAGDSYVTGSGWIEVGGSGSPIIGDPPAIPATPTPSDTNSTVSPITLVKLDWDDSLLATSYDVYLWLTSDGDRPASPTANVGISEYTLPSQVLSLENYKWQIVAKNTVGNTEGPVWTFSTTDRTQVPGNNGVTYSTATHNLNYIVGAGNTGKLLGNFIVHWQGGQGSFSVGVDTNGFILNADTGGGNGGHVASGPISGTGSFIIKHGPAGGAWDNVYTVSGSTANTYTGGTTLSQGHILMNKTAGVDALPAGTAPIILGSAGDSARLYWGANDQINDAAAITVLLPTVIGAAPDAYLNFLDLAGFSDTIAALILPDTGTKTQVRTGTAGVLTVYALTVNGEVKTPGVYTSSNCTFVTGGGSVTVLSTGTDTSTAVATSAASVTVGAPVTFTATVTPLPTGGSVEFREDGNPIGGGSVDVDLVTGEAALEVSNLPVGTHVITAIYSGDASYNTSTGTLSGGQTVLSTFDGWAVDKGLVEGNKGPNDDPDGDGANNLTEFAFGGNPKDATDSGKIYSVTAVHPTRGLGKELILTLAVRSGTPDPWESVTQTIDGITYTIEGSSNLTFPNGNVIPVAQYVTGAMSSALTDPDHYQYRSFILENSSGLPSNGFLRAKVEQ